MGTINKKKKETDFQLECRGSSPDDEKNLIAHDPMQGRFTQVVFMLIGIMSDAHDSIQGVKDALSIFSQRGVSMVLFAGDMIGSGNCYTFEGFGIPIKLVYGNNDGDRVGLFREFARLGGEYLGDFGEVEADGLRIALMHGTEEPLVTAVVASQIYDVVVRGHNHRYEVMQHGKTLLINPGEIWGCFTGLSSVAILNTADMSVEKIELGRFKTFREIIEG